MPESEFTTVYAGRPVDTHILKTILEEAGLNVFLKDEIMGTMVKGAQAVEVVIPTDELAPAMPITARYEMPSTAPTASNGPAGRPHPVVLSVNSL